VAKRPCYLVEGRPEPLQAVGIERPGAATPAGGAPDTDDVRLDIPQDLEVVRSEAPRQCRQQIGVSRPDDPGGQRSHRQVPQQPAAVLDPGIDQDSCGADADGGVEDALGRQGPGPIAVGVRRGDHPDRRAELASAIHRPPKDGRNLLRPRYAGESNLEEGLAFARRRCDAVEHFRELVGVARIAQCDAERHLRWDCPLDIVEHGPSHRSQRTGVRLLGIHDVGSVARGQHRLGGGPDTHQQSHATPL